MIWADLLCTKHYNSVSNAAVDRYSVGIKGEVETELGWPTMTPAVLFAGHSGLG